MPMSWLSVIKAGQSTAALQDDDEDFLIAEGDGFKEDEGKDVGLDPLISAALAAVLRITTAQLHILSTGGSAPRRSSVKSVGEKLVKDIQETEKELRTKNSFTTLFKCAREVSQKLKQMQVQEEIAAKSKKRIATLKARLEGNEKSKRKELNKKQEVITSLKEQIQDIVFRKDINLSYVDHWENSRREQNLMRCNIDEENLQSQLNLLVENCENEERVHQDLALYMELEMKNLEEEIEKWKSFYAEELVRRAEKLKALEERIIEERGKWTVLKELYEEHQHEMNEYLEYKELKRKEAERDQFIYDSATKIQAWWRGTMVRRGLGPYKRRKKPVKDKKKKK